jgi:hypothetical protein
MDTSTVYQQNYYLAHKEELNHARLRNYHRQRNGIPTEFFESYLLNKKIYNLLKKERDSLDKNFILYLFDCRK